MFIFKVMGCICVLFCVAFFNCGREPQKSASPEVAAQANSGKMFYLGVNNKSVSQPLSRDMRSPERYKFVQVEVVKVVNPNDHPISFEVHYDIGDGDRLFLGTFALYPSDNPGRFIVPTHGKLKNEGRLILSLVLPENVEKDDKLEIAVREMTFREE